MSYGLALLVFLMASSAGIAGEIVVEDQALRAPLAPDDPSGPKPVLRDCEVTTERTKDASGEAERTRRVCHWALPPS